MNMLRLTAIGGLAIAPACGIASAQGLPEGRVYAFHSQAQRGCPGMDWHIVVQANGGLEGMISWNNVHSLAHASGTVNAQAATFQMTATEQGGQGRTATINGTIRQDGWHVVDIQGPDVKCHGISVPWFVPYKG